MADLEHGSRSGPNDENDPGTSRLSENTPLLQSSYNADTDEHEQTRTRRSSAASLLRSFQPKSSDGRRWPSIIALTVLCILVVFIICLGFVAPSTVEEYANTAVTFDPTALSIESFTMHGVKARVRGNVLVDANRVSDKNVRRFGRFATWIAREVESGRSDVEVSLPEYGDVVLGTAKLPPIKVDVRNGHTTPVDFVAELRPGQVDSIKHIANDWVHGRLGKLEVVGKATVPIKSGIFRFGTHELVQTLVFGSKDVSIPQYQIKNLDIHDSTDQKIRADVSLRVENEYPVDFTLPPLEFLVSVAGCPDSKVHIPLANATTPTLEIVSGQPIDLDVFGTVQGLPDALLQPCAEMPDSPLDLLVAKYVKGQEITIFVQGSDQDNLDAPQWLADIISDIVVPVPFKGHALGELIREFSLSDVDFGLPDPLAEPGSVDAQPTISAIVNALINIPSEMNFDLDVKRVRADATVFYHDAELGKLDLSRWQQANSTRVGSKAKNDSGLLIQSEVEHAPLNITDDDVFTDVFQALLFGNEDVMLDVKAKVDVSVRTALGEFVLRQIPAAGSIPIKPIGKNTSMSDLDLKIGNLRVLDTTKESLILSALVNMTNPTNYTATVPYFDVLISHNGSRLGTASTNSLVVVPGLNQNIPITATWAPRFLGGEVAHEIGIELLSQYISGENTTITISTHKHSIPANPSLGAALSNLSIELPTPKLWSDSNKDGSDQGASQFVKDATMHLVTSTAVFVLASPLRYTELFITYINATALYGGPDGSDTEPEPVGHIIDFKTPFAVAPGGVPVTSPRLPVDWSLGSVGYDAVRGALGGSLKLACEALVGVRIGMWEERVTFKGHGIGAKVRL